MLKSFDLNKPNYSKVLSESVISWIDYGFYSENSYINTSGNLKRVNHPNYSGGMVWGSNKKNWVWEQDNITISQSGYTINYRDGLVIFDSVQTNVYASYSTKNIFVFNAKDNPFFRGDSKELLVYEGVYRENSLQLPCIALELGSSNSNPNAIGTYERNVRQDIILNIFHKNPDIVEKISDVLYQQIDSNIFLFDVYRSYSSGDYPLNFDGTLMNRSGTYNNLVNTHPFTQARNYSCYIKDSEIESVYRLDNNLYHGTVRFETEAELSMGIY
jgi:hypothetical protein